jgi:hypothetical protein
MMVEVLLLSFTLSASSSSRRHAVHSFIHFVIDHEGRHGLPLVLSNVLFLYLVVHIVIYHGVSKLRPIIGAKYDVSNEGTEVWKKPPSTLAFALYIKYFIC